MKNKLSWVIFLTLLGISCRIKTKLNKSDLAQMNVYNEKESLILKSVKGDFDTSIIVKKEMYYPQYNPIESDGKYLPQFGVVWYKNKKLEYNPDGDKLIYLIKETPHKVFLEISYLYSDILVLNLNSGTIEKYKHGKVYEFDIYDSRSKPWQPKKIFWDKDYGVIKYITHNNIVWERINLPK